MLCETLRVCEGCRKCYLCEKIARFELTIDPFTAPAHNISGLKCAQTRLLRVYFWGSITNLSSILCVLIKIPSHTNAKKKKGSRIQISYFYWSFSSGIKAVKRLRLVFVLYIYICGYIVYDIQTYTRAHARTYVHTLTRTNGERAGES